MLGVEGALAERLYGVHVNHVLEILIVPYLDLLKLVGGAEAVKEVDERNTTLDRGKVRHGAEIHDLLHVGLCEHGKAGLAAGHNVAVIAEDVQRVAGDGARGHVEHCGQKLAGNLVHIRDHQEQTLRGGVRGGESTGVESAVHGTGSTGFSLHLLHLYGCAENVLPAGRRPLIDVVRHGAGRSDGVDSCDFGKCVGYVGGRIVAVHGFEMSLHVYIHLH